MATSRIEDERIRVRSEAAHDAAGRYVLYWMQASQRAEHNPALERAIQLANGHDVPVVVAAVVIADYPDASPRHFAFMLGGLGRALRACERRGATVVVRATTDDPVGVVAELAGDAVEVVCDRGYLRHQRSWRNDLAERVGRRMIEVEGDVVVPVAVASTKQETAARTLRPKINRVRDDFLVGLATTPIRNRTHPDGLDPDVDPDDFDDIDALLDRLGLSSSDASVPGPVTWITPGTSAARSQLDAFLDAYDDYDAARNRYRDESGVSFLSPYLHYGQISPVYVANEISERAGHAAEDYLDQLVVRRELAMNFVEHCADYDSWAGLPAWARRTLEAHADDEREDVYTASELENGETDDDVWNAIMCEVRERGYTHNQLRMYWGKQVVRWTNTPQHAFSTLLDLNNRWFLDGRDANSYANVAWCFGLHDHGFAERNVLGTVRPFTTAALKRKDDLSAWLADVTDG